MPPPRCPCAGAPSGPVGLDRLARADHERLFVTPGDRFARVLAECDVPTDLLLPTHGERVVL